MFFSGDRPSNLRTGYIWDSFPIKHEKSMNPTFYSLQFVNFELSLGFVLPSSPRLAQPNTTNALAGADA